MVQILVIDLVLTYSFFPCLHSMEVSGENRKRATTPIREQRKKPYPLDITTVNETPAGTGTVNVGATLPKLNARPETNQSSLSPSPSKMSGNRRNKEGDSQQQLNSIKNYFQTVTKKRYVHINLLQSG